MIFVVLSILDMILSHAICIYIHIYWICSHFHCQVPAKDHPVGAKRPIYPDTEDWPRYIGSSRGPSYLPGAYPEGADQNTTKPIGYLPEIAHTYQYFDTNYGVMNEHQLHIGESTCSGVFGTSAVGSGGKALLSVNELSRIAMERCTSSRVAVQMMGDLAEKHGFYGAGSFEGTAESLLVGDTEEVFVFHVLPDDTGTSAIWVAQRVPDEHVTTVDNMFTIRHVNLTDTQNFYGSEKMHTIAEKKGWWKPSDGTSDRCHLV
jgi:dipeptidase